MHDGEFEWDLEFHGYDFDNRNLIVANTLPEFLYYRVKYFIFVSNTPSVLLVELERCDSNDRWTAEFTSQCDADAKFFFCCFTFTFVLFDQILKKFHTKREISRNSAFLLRCLHLPFQRILTVYMSIFSLMLIWNY